VADQVDLAVRAGVVDHCGKVGHEVVEPVGGEVGGRVGAAGAAHVVGDHPEATGLEQVGDRDPHGVGVGEAVDQHDRRRLRLAPGRDGQLEAVAGDPARGRGRGGHPASAACSAWRR
jgi:hypothetical protein